MIDIYFDKIIDIYIKEQMLPFTLTDSPLKIINTVKKFRPTCSEQDKVNGSTEYSLYIIDYILPLPLLV